MKRNDLFTLFVLFLMLSAVSSAVSTAEWMAGLGVAFWAMTFGLLAGAALAFSSFNGWTAHIASAIYGIFTLTIIGATHSSVDQTLDWRGRVFSLAERMIDWTRAAASNGTSRETVMFVLLLSALFWLLGYSAAWYSFRNRRIWHVLLPAGVTLFSNVFYYGGNRDMSWYMIIYVVCALTLLAHSYLADREESWTRDHVRVARGLRVTFSAAAIGLGMVALMAGKVVPDMASSPQAVDFFTAASGPYGELMARWNRLFSNLKNYNIRPTDYYASSFTLGGPRNLPPDPVMDITAPINYRYYWRAVSYDFYDGATWTSSFTGTRDLAANDQNLQLPEFLGRDTLKVSVALLRGSDSVYMPGQALRVGVPTQAKFRRYDDGGFDLLQLKVPVPLLPGNRYDAVGALSVATDKELQEAPAAPLSREMQQKYLAVPTQVPDRVKRTAIGITQRYTNTYDKAKAIETWLRTNIVYDDQLEAPPPGVEASDYIIFTTRRAYCNYYATAMAMMLRAVGVPARVSTGYAVGSVDQETPDQDIGVYHVKVSDSHTWPEVYFPNYGWIEFEPTAGQPELDRSSPEQFAGVPSTDFEPNPSIPRDREDEQEDELDSLRKARRDGLGALAPLADLVTGIEDIFNNAAPAVPWLFGLIALALLGWLGLRLAESRGIASLPPVRKAYYMLSRWATWLGIGGEHTPYEQAELVSERAPSAADPIRKLTTMYVEERFSGKAKADIRSEMDAETYWKTARLELQKAWVKARVFGLGRLRAIKLPRFRRTPRG